MPYHKSRCDAVTKPAMRVVSMSGRGTGVPTCREAQAAVSRWCCSQLRGGRGSRMEATADEEIHPRSPRESHSSSRWLGSWQLVRSSESWAVEGQRNRGCWASAELARLVDIGYRQSLGAAIGKQQSLEVTRKTLEGSGRFRTPRRQTCLTATTCLRGPVGHQTRVF